jgi:uncharacterized protein YciI
METQRRQIHTAAAAIAMALLGAAITHAQEVKMTQPEGAAPKASQLYVFLYRAGPAWKAGQPMEKQALGPHAAYIKGLLDRDRLVGGGRFEELDGGMAIIKAASPQEAQEILAADPAITSGVFVADLRAWTPRFRSAAPLP